MLALIPLIFGVVSSFAQSATLAQKEPNSWLHPGDAAYQTAIQDGFSGKANSGPHNEEKDGIHQLWFNFTTSRSKDNAIILFTPLRCAQLLGLNARQKSLDAPSVDDIRSICDGNLFATLAYTTKSKAASFPLSLDHDGVTVLPPAIALSQLPGISAHWNGTSYDDTYSYSGSFYFVVPEPWTGDVTLQYVIPEDGNPQTTKLDFSVFAKDDASYEGVSEKPTQTVSGTPAVLPNVSLTSDPAGAEVYVDDKFVGKTPTTLQLKPGQHYLRMFMDNYKNWSRQVTVEAGVPEHFAATLEKSN